MTKEQRREIVAARLGRPATETDIAQYAIDVGARIPGGVYECTAPLRVVANASVVYTDRGISRGMQYGIAAAERSGLPVEYRSIAGP